MVRRLVYLFVTVDKEPRILLEEPTCYDDSGGYEKALYNMVIVRDDYTRIEREIRYLEFKEKHGKISEDGLRELYKLKNNPYPVVEKLRITPKEWVGMRIAYDN